MEKIELRCLGCGEALDVMPIVSRDVRGLFQLVSPCNKCIGEELNFFRNAFPRAAANYVKVAAQQPRVPDALNYGHCEHVPDGQYCPYCKEA